MKVTVRLFARAKDLAGADQVTIEVADSATAGDLRRALGKTYPALGSLLSRCALAVNSEFAGDSFILSRGAEVALLPPVSGG